MKRVTSITMHMTSEGQRISYTYSVINENTGAITENNIRESMVVLNTPENKQVLEHIEKIQGYVNDKVGA